MKISEVSVRDKVIGDKSVKFRENKDVILSKLMDPSLGPQVKKPDLEPEDVMSPGRPVTKPS